MEKGKMTASKALQIVEKMSGEMSEGNVTKEMMVDFNSAKVVIEKLLKAEVKKEEKKNFLNHIQFTLTMPQNNSWNHRWTGEEKLFAKAYPIASSMTVQKAEEILRKKNFRYNFGDGWVMNIEATKITAVEAREVNKKSSGFMGYEWAIRSILDCLEIRVDE